MKTISFDDFIKKYLGEGIDYDGVWSGQCVDLYRFYTKEVLGFEQSVPVGGAADIWHTAQPKYYDFISNTPKAVPQKGDIVIWNRNAGGGFGHVAIFIKGGINRFTSLDQNWPSLNKVTKTKHNYKNIIGWLRPKGDSMWNSPAQSKELKLCLKQHAHLMKEIKKKDEKYELLKEDLKREVRAGKTRKDQYEKFLRELSIKLGPEVDTKESNILAAIDTLIGYEDENRKFKKKFKEMEEKGEVVVRNPDHSRLCNFIAKIENFFLGGGENEPKKT